MLVMDSGIGGIAVVRALRALAPSVKLAYLADTAGFPYGNRDTANITARAFAIIRALEKRVELSTIVLACNTLSTLCLTQLRAEFPYRFVGTVPAIKVAAAASHSKRFTLLATPNTAQSSYSKNLIAEFAQGCTVDCYGAPNLASYAERTLLGESIADELWRAEIAPAFHNGTPSKTDAVVLGCTHYPLVLEQLKRAAPWEVQWIDSSEAIARHALSQPAAPNAPMAYVTTEKDIPRYQAIFAREGFMETVCLAVTD